MIFKDIYYPSYLKKKNKKEKKEKVNCTLLTSSLFLFKNFSL